MDDEALLCVLDLIKGDIVGRPYLLVVHLERKGRTAQQALASLTRRPISNKIR